MHFDILMRRHAAQSPSAIALHDDQGAISYAELAAEVERVAALLAAQGARAGDRLALWLPNGRAWLLSFLACARLGVTVVSVNTRFRSQEVGDLISRSQARWLVLWPAFNGLPFQQILSDVPLPLLHSLRGVMLVGGTRLQREVGEARQFSFDSPADVQSLADVTTVDGAAPALIYTTSGTTSLPKLVLHDQRTLLHHGTNVARYFGIGAADVLLLGAPFCGAFGFSSALGALAVGAPMVTSALIDPGVCAAQIAHHGVTHTFANNELLDRILMAATARDLSLVSLRVVGFASFAPSLEDLPARAEQAGIRLLGLYGSSELQALVAAQPLDDPLEARQRPGGCLIDPSARLRVRDVETGEILPHGEVGEVEIQSPSLMRGYLNDAPATARAVDAEGYFSTGDLGHSVDERRFVFHARRGDYLRLSGFLVNPREIESYLEAQPGVASCQVVGAVQGGKAVPVAFVIATAGATIAERALIDRCRANLARFKVPLRIGVLSAFPVVESANSNKIQRSKLQALANALLEELH